MSSIDLKVTCRSETSRTSLAASPIPTHATLVAHFTKLFDVDASKAIKLGYIDEDGDKVILADDNEVEEFWKANADDDETSPPLRFFVTLVDKPSQPISDPEDAPLPDYRDESTTPAAEPRPPFAVETLREAFEAFIQTISTEGTSATNAPNGIFSALADMVEQASGLAENAADHSEEFGHRVGFEFRCGVEDFLSGIFRGVGLNERGHRGFRRGGRGRRAFFNAPSEHQPPPPMPYGFPPMPFGSFPSMPFGPFPPMHPEMPHPSTMPFSSPFDHFCRRERHRPCGHPGRRGPEVPSHPPSHYPHPPVPPPHSHGPPSHIPPPPPHGPSTHVPPPPSHGGRRSGHGRCGHGGDERFPHSGPEDGPHHRETYPAPPHSGEPRHRRSHSRGRHGRSDYGQQTSGESEESEDEFWFYPQRQGHGHGRRGHRGFW